MEKRGYIDDFFPNDTSSNENFYRPGEVLDMIDFHAEQRSDADQSYDQYYFFY